MHFSLRDLYLSLAWVVTTYVAYVVNKIFPSVEKVIPADTALPASIDVYGIAKLLQKRSSNVPLKIDRSSRTQASNSMRIQDRSGGERLTIRLGPANRVLMIDTERCLISVEPGVTMEKLVDALLPHGLVPFVVPEFRALTVGGVLAGAGIESSSWAHGQFGDSLTKAQYILSDGMIVDCSSEHNSDLFYGAMGACGSLGLLVSATIKVQRITSNFVRLEYFDVPVEKSIGALKARLDMMRKDTHKQGLLDAIVYKDKTVLIAADYDAMGPVTQSLSRGRDPWFYQHVQARSNQHDILHIKDYLFRYDAGAFWMSQYAISPLTDLQTFFHEMLPPITDPYVLKILSLIPFGGYNRISRWLLSPLLRTDPMYKRLHQAPIHIIADSLVIQDVYIPTCRSDEFLAWVRAQFGFEKIWLCPMKSSSTAQIISPHHVATDSADGFVNFGIWLHKPKWQPGRPYARKATRDIERKVADLGGRKMLYSLSHYTSDEWAAIYDTKAYGRLKRKWDPYYAFGDIYKKVGSSD